jgi:ribosomal protein L22
MDTPETNPSADAEETADSHEPQAPRRGRRAAEQPAAEPAAEQPAAEQPTGEEAPKPARRRRAAAEAQDAPAEEEAPKRRRPRVRAKAAEAEESAQEPVAEEAPKPRRTRAKAAAAEEAASEPEETEEAPKPARRRRPRVAAEESAAEGPEDEQAPATPAPAPRRPRVRTPRPALRRGRRTPEPELEPILVFATARYVRSSARKARMVCGHIRGKSVPEARAILAFAPRGVAKDWSKLLNSAVANAEHNYELIGDELRVKEAYADEGPTLKRFRPRAMGRATPILKRTAHLSITLSPEE